MTRFELRTGCPRPTLRMVTPNRASVLLLPVIYLGFISLGLPDGTLGVAWPTMHSSLQLPIGLAGLLLLVVTLLAAISSFSSGRIIERFRTGPVVLVSCALTGTSLVLLSNAHTLVGLILAALPLGFGAGAVDSGLNGYVARHYSGRHMNWLHACWGIGATCGPLVMAASMASLGGWRTGYLILGAVQLSLALVFAATLRLWETVPERTAAHGVAHEAAATPTLQANTPAGWLSATIFAVYVAIEGTAGLWAGSILVESRAVPPHTAGLCVSAYYGSITVGRIVAGFAVDSWGNRRIVTVGTVIAMAGACVFALAHTTGIAAMGLVLLGLGFAPVYPCLMHEVPRRFAPEAVATVIGRQSGAAYIGGAALPALAGWLAHVSLESIAWSVVAGLVLMIGAIRVLDRAT